VCPAVWIGNCVPCSMDWKLCALQYGLETVCPAVVLTVNLCMNCFLKSVICNVI